MAVASINSVEASAAPQSAAEAMPFEVCVPLYRTITPETHGSLMGLMQVCPWLTYRHKVGARLMDALESFAVEPQEPYMLMIDGDMVFTPQDVVELFNALVRRPEMGAIGGLYRKWQSPYTHLANWRLENGSWPLGDRSEKRIERYKESGEIVNVDLWGGGFIMCLTSVFEKLERPYFRSGEDEGGRYGQDTYFAKSLNEAGYKPSIHFGVQVGHIGPRKYMP